MRERQEALIVSEELLEEALVGAGRRVAGRELEALQAREERGEACVAANGSHGGVLALATEYTRS